MACKCPDHSPFRWKEDDRASIFATDVRYTPAKNGLTKSANSTAVVERERSTGNMTGTLRGLSRKESPVQPPPVKDFHVYARAGKDKVKFNAAA